MKFLFIGLSSYYTEGMNYQDNAFCDILLDAGHDVTFISNPEAYVNGVKTYVGSCDKILSNRLRLIRVKYKFPTLLSKKLKIFDSIYDYINNINPDIIYCHGTQYYNIHDVIKYKKSNYKVKVYADTHTGYYNASIDKWYFPILYKIYYRNLYKSIEPYLEKYFYIGSSDKEFSIKEYNADESKMYFLPLGGNAIDDKSYNNNRDRRRRELNIKDNDIMILHSGKLDEKKNTDWLIETLNRINDERLKLVIIGNIPAENKKLFELINNNNNQKNIIYLGWRDSNDLLECICASDIYAQPGSPSVTLNNAICYETPVIAYKHKLYSEFFGINSIYWIKDKNELESILNSFLTNISNLNNLKKNARNNKYILDYKINLFKAMNIEEKK